MKFELKDIFGKSSKRLLKCTPYRHTEKYKHYVGNAVSIEKKLLTDRGLDEFNVGHNTRSFEIEKFVEDELCSAKKQLNEHLNEYKAAFDERLSEVAVKRAEVNQLRQDAAALNRHIQNLESILSQGGSINDKELK